jgi:hypothetical protein
MTTMGITTAMAIVPPAESPPSLLLALPGVAELDAPAGIPAPDVDDVVGSGDGVLICVTMTVDGGTGVPLLGATLTTDVMICVDGGAGGAVEVDVVAGGGAAVVGVVVGVVVGGGGGAVVGSVVGAVVGVVVVGGRGVVVSGSVVVSGTPGVDIVNDQSFSRPSVRRVTK